MFLIVAAASRPTQRKSLRTSDFKPYQPAAHQREVCGQWTAPREELCGQHHMLSCAGLAFIDLQILCPANLQWIVKVFPLAALADSGAAAGVPAFSVAVERAFAPIAASVADAVAQLLTHCRKGNCHSKLA